MTLQPRLPRGCTPHAARKRSAAASPSETAARRAGVRRRSDAKWAAHADRASTFPAKPPRFRHPRPPPQLSSLPLQILLYFDNWWVLGFLIYNLFVYIYKGASRLRPLIVF